MQTGGQTVLFVGDLSYADRYEYNDGVRWDSWGRLIEKSAAYQPWIWTAGNHDIDFRPDLVLPILDTHNQLTSILCLYLCTTYMRIMLLKIQKLLCCYHAVKVSNISQTI